MQTFRLFIASIAIPLKSLIINAATEKIPATVPARVKPAPRDTAYDDTMVATMLNPNAVIKFTKLSNK